MWLNQLKSALIIKDVEKISALLEDVPALTKQELGEASHLLREAALVATELRDETAKKMKLMKKHIDFLHSTENQKKQKFDITS
jgi:hypothetical protein